MSDALGYGIMLFLAAFVSGFIALRVTSGTKALSFFLVFTGGYMFAITIVHMFPEIYPTGIPLFWIGVMVLVGFFIQQFLEFFTSGVEHGHIHELNVRHHHNRYYASSVVVALAIHSLLEGSVLSSIQMETMFFGILLHKAPAAFALITVLRCYNEKKGYLILSLLIFSLASPFGILLGTYIPESWGIYLLAIVSGSFLQISTTIVFENTADHKFNLKKLVYSLSGAIVAILAEMFFL